MGSELAVIVAISNFIAFECFNEWILTPISLFLQEYEKNESPESKFVKDLDRLDMVMQALEYEKRDDCPGTHQEFFDSTEGKFNHPMVQRLVEEIKNQRIEMIKSREQAKSVEKQN